MQVEYLLRPSADACCPHGLTNKDTKPEDIGGSIFKQSEFFGTRRPNVWTRLPRSLRRHEKIREDHVLDIGTGIDFSFGLVCLVLFLMSRPAVVT